MLSKATQMALWSPPPNETVAAIGAALCAHWVAAKAAAKAQFWSKSRSWIEMPRRYLNSVTTSR